MNNITIDELITIIEKEHKDQENIAEYLEVRKEPKHRINAHKIIGKRYSLIADCLKELKRYKELEEKGLLYLLPCKEGDIVYKIINQRDNFDNIPYKIVTTVEFRLSMFGEIGKTVFLSKTDAEQKLKGDEENA